MQNLQFIPSDIHLAEYIFSYGILKKESSEVESLTSTPNGFPGFVFRTKCVDCQVNAKNIEGNLMAHQASYVIGQTTSPIIGKFQGELEYLYVFFNPLGLYQLFGQPMNLLTDKTTDLIDYLGIEKFNHLWQNLLLANGLQSQIQVLDNFFLNLKPIKEDFTHIKKALQLIHEAKGNISVTELEEICEVNRRMIERQFQKKIGISPKVYAQIYRFKMAMNYLQQNPKTSWAELSNIVGYYDQAHLIRYFKEYLKVSPNNLATLNTDFINYFLRY